MRPASPGDAIVKSIIDLKFPHWNVGVLLLLQMIRPREVIRSVKASPLALLRFGVPSSHAPLQSPQKLFILPESGI